MLGFESRKRTFSFVEEVEEVVEGRKEALTDRPRHGRPVGGHKHVVVCRKEVRVPASFISGACRGAHRGYSRERMGVGWYR